MRRCGRDVRWIALVAVVLATVLAPGCCPAVRRLYDGPARPDAEVAVIRAAQASLGIDSVDGQGTICFPDTPASEVRVLPGQHRVQARWSDPSVSLGPGHFAVAHLEFEALGGHGYRIVPEPLSDQVSFRVEDEATGRVVAGATATRETDWTARNF
jgi:hypothetical protein